MNEKPTEVIDINTRQSIDRVMDPKPASLVEAIRMDLNALLPQSESARERRAHVVELGKKAVEVAKRAGIVALVAVPTGLLATAAVDTFVLPKVEVGSTVTLQGEGDGLSTPITEGLQIISDETGNNVTGADYRDGVSDLSDEGVGNGYKGMPVEVTAYESPIFGFPSVEATTNITSDTATETFPPALPLDGAEDVKND